MTPTTARASPTDTEAWPVLAGIDMAAAQRSCGSSYQLYERMLGLPVLHYRSWTEDWLAATRASEVTDNSALCASLHKLRGSDRRNPAGDERDTCSAAADHASCIANSSASDTCNLTSRKETRPVSSSDGPSSGCKRKRFAQCFKPNKAQLP